MKKIIITLGVLFAASTAFTQGAYATFGLGYAGSTTGEQLGSTYVTSGSTWTSTNIMGTLGAGIPINLSGGYMLNKHIGVELGLSYLIGSEITVDENTNATTSEISKSKHSSVRISPMLVLSTGSEGLNLYSKLGLILPVTGKTVGTNETTDVATGVVTNSVEQEFKGKVSMGYTASVGVAFPIMENFSIFGELQMLNLRIKRNTSEITKYEINGVEQLSNLDKRTTHVEYVDEVQSTDNGVATETRKELTSSSNFSSLGLNVGIKMKF